MLNTGTIVDTGALIFRPIQDLKYIEPFSWGPGEKVYYEWERFLKDIRVIMKRRSCEPSPLQVTLLNELYMTRFSV